VSSRNQIVKQVDGRLRDLPLIEEFDHQGQIDGEPKQVIRVNLPIGPKAGDASEDGDPLHGSLALSFCAVRDPLRSGP